MIIPQELYIFAHHEHARFCGFRNGRHPEHPEMMAWWPASEVDQLRGFRFSRVVVSEGARQAACQSANLMTNMVRALHQARINLTFEPKLWIEF